MCPEIKRPKKVAEAPSSTKTIEKPATNRRELIKTRGTNCPPFSLSESSSTDTSDIKEM
jgi:hypothetical protein